MASLRQLPSGVFQASVLLDSGKRTTHTAPTLEEADAWAAEVEAKRNAEREARRDRDADQSIAVHISGLDEYARRGLLTSKHRAELLRIARG